LNLGKVKLFEVDGEIRRKLGEVSGVRFATLIGMPIVNRKVERVMDLDHVIVVEEPNWRMHCRLRSVLNCFTNSLKMLFEFIG
jgi:hypothetical protein